MFFTRPKIKKLIDDELYQVEREVLGLEEKVFRLKVLTAQAEAALALTCERRDALRDQSGSETEVSSLRKVK